MAQPTKGLLNPTFKYRPSWNTDIRETIAKEYQAIEDRRDAKERQAAFELLSPEHQSFLRAVRQSLRVSIMYGI